MANVEICGVAVGDARDSVEEEPAFVDESTGRTVNGTHYDERTLRKRKWRFRTSFKTPAEAEALRRFAEGDGHLANFVEDDLYTSKGVAAELLSDASITLTGGKHSARVSVVDGEYLGWVLANRMSQPDGNAWTATSGFTLMCWRKDPSFEALGDGATFHHYVVTGAVHHTRGASADPAGFTQYRNGAAGSFGVGEWIAMLAGGIVRLNGWANTGDAEPIEFSDVVILPFEIPASWVPQIYSYADAYAWPTLRQIAFGGNCIEDAAPAAARVRVTRLPQRGVVFEGTFESAARLLEFLVSEV